MSFDHWFVMDSLKSRSFDCLVEYVHSVSVGLLLPIVSSESCSLQKFAGTNFLDGVYDNTIDSSVPFTQNNSFKESVYRILLSSTSPLFNETLTPCFWIDVNSNDLHANIPPMTTYPALIV
jgi:hypothetical protein